MANINETGHAKNVANFEKLVTRVASLGAVYNPSRESLTITALNALLASAREAVHNVHNAEAAYKHAVGERELAFDQLRKLTTRINNALKASSSTSRDDASVMTLIRKLQGRRATPKMTPEERKAAEAAGIVKNEISSSQLGYDNRLDNLDKLLKLLITIPEYAPNEPELTTHALAQLHTDLARRNSDVANSAVQLANARIARDARLYSALNGMVDISVDVKMYVKSVYGTTNPYYKALSTLKFSKQN
ncbi:MAG: hypothetical protein KBH01_02020 [Breznakibacter sp.]|nr:hypothetical protein [Breznakibacter sp.]